ncbi:chorismate mutase family protein [Streptomyces prasinus]|uniref:Chorismate mutase family protein n=1 Tax=Streptomyces prasinus TaxID=67345 RepID=A0ABX6AQI6_9ACTN|nr:chorismate mutase family protein [Streptomyces prasinus]QEV04991.1 chorismate mutase family protein [Streptomyces prasinus]
MTYEHHTDSRGSQKLEALRAELDGVDKRLRETLRERIEICVRIAEHKREHAVSMMQPHRINIVQERAARFASENQIDQTFIRRFYDLIIEETCRVEDLVIAGKEWN